MSLAYSSVVATIYVLMMTPHSTRKDVTLSLVYLVETVGGDEITDMPLKNNTNIIISLLAANCSKAIWGEDAEEWRLGSVEQAHLLGVYASMCVHVDLLS